MIKNILKVLISNTWVLVISLINGFIIPKILSVNEYANYSLFILYISYISALHLGFPSGMFIKYGGTKYDLIEKKNYKSELIIVYMILTFFTLVGVVSSIILSEKYLFYVSIAILPVCIVGSFKFLYQAWGMFGGYSKLNMVMPSSISLFVILSYIVWGSITSELMILIYLIVYITVAIIITIKEFAFVKGTTRGGIITKENWDLEKMGFAMMVGNYINVLFHSLDKMFINVLFTKEEFAMYAFAMQMQIIMTLFISAISQPLYYKLSIKNSDSDLSIIKEMLLIFGSFSGTAYFVCSIIVTNFIPKYTNSLDVIRIYFAVFPVMAVISSLYINLYKINRKMKRYIQTLTIVFVLAFTLNSLGVLITDNYLVIAASTTLVYYIWFIYSGRHFSEISINKKDIFYLMGFLFLFFIITNNVPGVLGMIIYTIFISIFAYFMYKSSITKVIKALI